MSKTRTTIVVVAALALATGVWATIGSAAARHGATPKVGGTYRIGVEQSFSFTDAFDPTGEYLGNAFGIYSNLLVRTLVGYNHVAGAAGNRLVPDLATSVPTPTNGGKTYTFHLKSGIKFGPPVSREITSKDILYAMQRLANPKDGGQYAFYYTVIKGWDAYANGKAKSISGIKTPNAKTIVFNLTEPTGDFLYRVGMPATGPIPVEVAKCFSGANANRYGRDLVSSGPYMIQGADQVSTSSCSAIKPMAGFDGQTNLTLVRNPDYKASTDSRAARENFPDSFVFTVDANSDDIFNKIQAGELEDEWSQPSPKVLRQYVTNASLKSRLHINSGDRTWYITMNLSQPPFDDIHVRKAMNFIMDKDALRKAWGGPTAGEIGTHIVPDTMFNNQLKGWDPYKTPGAHGSVALAKAAMKGSKYDTAGNGTCNASQCKNVLLIADVRGVDTRMLPIIQADAAKIGITFKVRSVNGAYPVIQTPSKNVPISERPGWGKDYADPLTFFEALFTSGAIIPSGNTNYSLVGITPAIAKQVHASGNFEGIPSIDSQFAKCNVMSGNPRMKCWESLDKYLMTNVVPWVPYLFASTDVITGPNVTKWTWDQFSGTSGYAHVAVK